MQNRRQFAAILTGALALTGCGKEGASGKAPSAATTTTTPPNAAPLDKSTESELAYAIELKVADNLAFVKEDHKFRSNDLFHLLLRPEFDAYVYMVGRGPRQPNYTVLYPGERTTARNPVQAGEKVTIPDPDTGWLHMDEEKGDETLILVASTAPLAEFAGMGATVDRDDFESRLAEVERQHRPVSSRRFEDGDWVKLFAARGKENLAIVLRLPLLHQ